MFAHDGVLRPVAVALAIAYPILAHIASVTGSHALTLASVVLLGVAVLWQPLLDARRWAIISVPFAALAAAALVQIDAISLVLFVPPVLLNAWLAWLFGHTLAGGRTALIERLVRLLQPPGVALEPGVVRYAQRLTRAWTSLFVALGATNLALAILAPRDVWSLFANLLNYAIVAVFFGLEYTYRRRRFPERPYRNFLHFLRRVADVSPALLAGLRGSSAPTMEAPLDHPAYAGHFPVRPLLPGVVLLERVIEEAARQSGCRLRTLELPWVKFLTPLAPGDRASIDLRSESGTLHFEVRREGQRVAQGVMRVGPGPETG